MCWGHIDVPGGTVTTSPSELHAAILEVLARLAIIATEVELLAARTQQPTQGARTPSGKS